MRSRAGRVAAASEEPHELDIEGLRVRLTLRRSQRRSFALQVDHRGARVSVPMRTPLVEVEHFVRGHGAWLLERLKRSQQRMAAPQLMLVDGVELPLFGCPLRLRVGGVRRSQWRLDDEGREELHLCAHGDVAQAVQRALRARALAWYRERVELYCQRLGLPVPMLRLTSARTRWGSCSSRSGVRLHWRLVHLPPALIDYVVAHELAHLREMNHSPRFWAVVESVYPDWREARARLRAAALQLPVFGTMKANDSGLINAED